MECLLNGVVISSLEGTYSSLSVPGRRGTGPKFGGIWYTVYQDVRGVKRRAVRCGARSLRILPAGGASSGEVFRPLQVGLPGGRALHGVDDDEVAGQFVSGEVGAGVGL